MTSFSFAEDTIDAVPLLAAPMAESRRLCPAPMAGSSHPGIGISDGSRQGSQALPHRHGQLRTNGRYSDGQNKTAMPIKAFFALTVVFPTHGGQV